MTAMSFQRYAITCFLFHKLNVCLKMCDCVVAAMRALPPAMTDHLSHHQHFFTWRHQHTLAHFSNYSLTFPLTPSRLSDQNNFQRLTLHLPHIIFTTSFNSTNPEKNKSSRFYPQPPLSSVHFIITWRFNPAVSRVHWHQGWGQDWQARRLWWDEPDHELVIGYNCPGLTDFTKSFSPVAGATEPQMTQGARPLLSQGSKRADLDANSSPRAKRDKARPPHLSWCGLQFVGRTPWQTECDRSATLPVAAAAPSRTWVHTRR